MTLSIRGCRRPCRSSPPLPTDSCPAQGTCRHSKTSSRSSTRLSLGTPAHARRGTALHSRRRCSAPLRPDSAPRGPSSPFPSQRHSTHAILVANDRWRVPEPRTLQQPMRIPTHPPTHPHHTRTRSAVQRRRECWRGTPHATSSESPRPRIPSRTTIPDPHPLILPSSPRARAHATAAHGGRRRSRYGNGRSLADSKLRRTWAPKHV